MSDELNLLSRIKKGTYEVSVAASYNIYFPFYEDVVLRRLTASGCRANVLLADHRQLSQSFASPDLRPRDAGYDYTLMGIRAPTAFHPKIILLAGARSGLAIVGSHNLTFSGFGHNREVSTIVSIAGKKDTEGVAFARQIWTFLKSWIDHEKDRLPPEVIATANKAGSTVSWLRGKADSNSSLTFIGKEPGGPSLWSQIKPTLPAKINRVTVVGPFFDKGLRLPLAMREELSTSEMIAGIDPDTVEIDVNASAGSEISFVNAHALGPHARYLHAKIAYLEDTGGDHTLVLGSANPSSPAWLEDGIHGNAEAVVVHRGSRARELAEKLGLTSLRDSPVLGGTDWTAIKSRQPQQSEASDPNRSAPAVGVSTASGIEIVDRRFSSLGAERAFQVYSDGDERRLLPSLEHSDDRVFIPVDSKDLQHIRLIEVQCSDGSSTLAFVHHGDQLDSRCQTSRQSKLRIALASLDGETTDIAGLVTLVDKMIFSPDAQIDPPAPASNKSRGESTTDESSIAEEKPIDSLSASIQDSRKAKRRQRRLAPDGDLGAILDSMVYHLGVSPTASAAGLDSKGRNEEERVNSDDDDENRSPIPVDMIRSCQKKIRTLVTRMGKQFALVNEEDQRRALVVVQLCAVISVLRELRIVDKNADWVGPGHSLVPISERRRLLEVSLGYLFGEQHQLLKKSIEDRKGETFDEISRLKGLLLWLAWDGGLRGDQVPTLSDTPDERRRKLLDRARIVVVSRHVADDSVANEEVSESVARVSSEAARASATGWLSQGFALGERVNGGIKIGRSTASRAGETPGIGDLVSAGNSSEPRIVVREKQDKVFLADLDEATQEKGFLSNRARVVLTRSV